MSDRAEAEGGQAAWVRHRKKNAIAHALKLPRMAENTSGLNTQKSRPKRHDGLGIKGMTRFPVRPHLFMDTKTQFVEATTASFLCRKCEASLSSSESVDSGKPRLQKRRSPKIPLCSFDRDSIACPTESDMKHKKRVSDQKPEPTIGPKHRDCSRTIFAPQEKLHDSAKCNRSASIRELIGTSISMT